MKKILLSLAVALSACLGASALNRLPLMSNPNFPIALSPQEIGEKVAKAPARAEEGATPSMEYNISGEAYNATTINNATTGTRFALALEMTPEEAARFAGNTITEVSFYTGGRANSSTGMNYVIDYTVFVTNDLQKEPITKQEFKASRKVLAKQTAALDNPITIEAGKSYYFGVEFTTKSANDCGLIYDGVDHGDNIAGGWYAVYNEAKEAYVWDNYADQLGFNCISATVVGESLPQNGAIVSEIGVVPNNYTDTPFEVAALITNNASNPVENLEFTVTVGDNEPVSKTFVLDQPIAYAGTTVVRIPNFKYSKPGTVIVKAEVTKVNGVANTIFDNAVETEVEFFAPGTAFPTTVVAEEFTGTWCGWCPFGLYCMEYMQEKYPDSFIVVAAHSGDQMTATTLSSLLNMNSQGYPYVLINRMYGTTPQFIDEVESYYTLLHEGTLAPGKVSAECALSDDKTTLVINTTTLFGNDTDNSNGKYRLAYVITEDNVGPYNQTNNLSKNSQYSQYGDWSTKGSSVPTMYEDVARYMDGFPGLANSLPAAIKAGEEIKGEHNIKVPSNIQNISNINLVVYLMNNTRNEIVNACKVKSGDIKGNESAIKDVNVDNSEAPVEYFNLQGVRVQNPSNGLYIRRQGTDVKKVIL